MSTRCWFGGVVKMVLRFSEAVSRPVLGAMEGCGNGLLMKLVKKAVCAAFTCMFATGGAVVGMMAGALKGQTTETGFLRGGTIGLVAGAITAVQLLDSMADGETLSEVALLGSLANGKIFMEWVSPAVLKAYQWQVTGLETTNRESPDIYETSYEVRGLSQNQIQKFSIHKISSTDLQLSCPICLHEFGKGDLVRKLPSCEHRFHVECIDEWLIQQGSCPICRKSFT